MNTENQEMVQGNPENHEEQPERWTRCQLSTNEIENYLIKVGCTPEGAEIGRDAVSWVPFKRDEIFVHELTEAFGEDIKDFHGNVNASQPNRPTRGFKFRSDTPQRVFLIKGITMSRLTEPDEFGLERGDRECMYVLFPEVLKEAEDWATGTGLYLPDTTTAYYHPILRIMPRGLRDVVIPNKKDKDGAPVYKTEVFFPGQISGTGNFGANAPDLIYRAAIRSGLTPEEMCRVMTSTAQVALERRNRETLNPNRRTAAASRHYDDAVTV
jgi:hypothetical protein